MKCGESIDRAAQKSLLDFQAIRNIDYYSGYHWLNRT